MPLDPQVRAYIEELVAIGARPANEMSVEEARRVAEERAPALFGPVEEVALVEDLEVPGPAGMVPVRLYRPSASNALPLLVYFHGGGWVTGSIETIDGVCRSLSIRAACAVASAGYRKAPEHRFPAAVDDAWAVVEWAGSQEYAGLAVGGDSAGGNLAAVMALRARDRGGPRLSLQLLVYPVTDHDFETTSYRENASGYVLTRDAMRWYWDHYVPDAPSRAHPDASPLRAERLDGVAPAVVLTCEFDPLRDEGEAYARRLADAGVPVVCRRYDGMVHGAWRWPAKVDRSWQMIDDAAAAIRSAFAALPAA
jgi:acetyl esterase